MDLCSEKEIQELLLAHGFYFSKSMGQNFLTARWVPERIAAESGADKKTGVLEIGPGVGCLTRELSSAAGRVAAVELDERLIPVLQKTVGDCENVSVINGDIMKLDLEAIATEHFSGLEPAVCANLPYNITTPVLTRLINSALFPKMTVMIQREAAQRICAGPGDPDYCMFSLFVNYWCAPEILFDVPPSCFTPAPKVTSSVISLPRRDTPPAAVTDEKLFFRVARAAFLLRRKTLLNAVASGLAPELSKEDTADAIRACGLPETVRGETLGIPEFAALTAEIGRRMK